MGRSVERLFFLAGLCAVIVFGLIFASVPQSRKVSLPTSKTLTTPSPGLIGRLNSFPATIALSPDRRYAAFLNEGYGTQESGGRQSISVLDLKTGQISDFPDDRLGERARQTYFLGLLFSADGSRLYASMASITDVSGEQLGDTGNGVAVYRFREGEVEPERFLKIPPQKLARDKKISYELRRLPAGMAVPYPAGLAIVHDGGEDHLLIADNLSDNVVLLNPGSGQILREFDLSTSDLVPSAFPYTVVVTGDGRRAWCSLWNASRVAELDLESGKITRWISLLAPNAALAPGSHPTALLLSPDEKLLYVALSNADAVAVVSTGSGSPVRLLKTTVPEPAADPLHWHAGTYPEALALSADGARLFVADAAINAVAVFDVSRIHPQNPVASPPTEPAIGFIPTDWYPSALAMVNDDLLIATAKGQGSGPNNRNSRLPAHGLLGDHPYIPTLISGSVARLKLSDIAAHLDALTRQVEEDNLVRSAPARITFAQGGNPIHHVIYVLKENRTYDQILGDLKVGNGDSSLTMYGEGITPNQHQLARQFGVLDNFYDSGEVSGNGHVWSMAAITSDYDEKTWPIAYRGKEHTYDFQGIVAGEVPLEHDQPDVNEPGTGYLWNNLARNHLGYRDYGEFVAADWCRKSTSSHVGIPPLLGVTCEHSHIPFGEPLPSNVGQPHGSASPWPWVVPLMSRVRATQEVLRDHIDSHYPDFNVDYPDQLRADEFLNEFEGFVAARGQGKGTELPAFVLLYLPNDHTGGTRPGKPTPGASIADNDLALGRVVEAVSHSPYWDDTAILVLEDDAQNGVDHVDAHRSIAFVISKYSPGSLQTPLVAHDFFTTVSAIHTIEVLLGLPPMNQNDAYAPVMAPLFTGAGAQPPFVADFRNLKNGLIYQTNSKADPGARESLGMDFSRPDAANAFRLNSILWRAAKGVVPMPPAAHTVFPSEDSD